MAALDTIDYIFVARNFAKYIWGCFGDLFGIDKSYTSLRNMVMRRWSAKHYNDAHKLVLQSTPIFICWCLWKNRCACKYGGKSSNSFRFKFEVFKNIFFILSTAFPYISWPSNLRDMMHMLEGYIHDMKVIKVIWQKPAGDFVKLIRMVEPLSPMVVLVWVGFVEITLERSYLHFHHLWE